MSSSSPRYDLRSDTVSQPTPAMREAIAAAAVGDDCYADDPTVNELESRAAELFGKPAALFCASGTLANQLAVSVHTRPGQALACSPGTHVQVHEDASSARISGVQAMPIGTLRGGYSAAELEALIHEEESGWPHVALAWVENTLGLGGGRVWPLESMKAIRETATRHGRRLHLDGARIWNAAVASGVPLDQWAAQVDTVSACLSKGLGCPAGSILVGPEDLIAQARATRHGLGGAMRQAGILAAAGLFALDENVDRLAEDHRRAKALSEGLAGLHVWNAVAPETNICLFDVDGPAEPLCAKLRAAGVVCYPNRYREIRLVVHLGIDDAAVDDIVRIAHSVFG